METEKRTKSKKRFDLFSPKFIHFGWYGQTMRRGKKKHDGVLTVAYRRNRLGLLQIGFIFCSPSDHFSRKEGRKEALKYMRNYPITVYQNNTDSKKHTSTIVEIIGALCGSNTALNLNYNIPEHAIYHSTTSRIPGWAKKWWKSLPDKPIPKRTLTDSVLRDFESRSMLDFIKEAKKAGLSVEVIADPDPKGCNSTR